MGRVQSRRTATACMPTACPVILWPVSGLASIESRNPDAFPCLRTVAVSVCGENPARLPLRGQLRNGLRVPDSRFNRMRGHLRRGTV